MSAIDDLETKINDARTDARQMRDFTEQLLRQVTRLREQYLEIDKSMGEAFTAFAVDNSERARQDLKGASGLDALREIARRVLEDARSIEQLLQNYY